MPRKINRTIDVIDKTVITKSDGTFAEATTGIDSIININGDSQSNVALKKHSYSDNDFFTFDISSSFNKTLCVMPTTKLLVFNKRHEDIDVAQARDIVSGTVVLEPVPNISYTGRDTISASELNDFAVSIFGKSDRSDAPRDMTNMYAKLFKKDSKLTIEAMMFLGMVYANGRNVIKNEKRRTTSCTVNVVSPVSEAAKCFISKALDDLGIEFPIMTYEKNRNSDRTDRLQSASKKTYILMRYIFGDDRNGDKDLSKLLHISTDHDKALMYGIISPITTISDRSHERRADEAFINCDGEQMMMNLYTLMLLNGIRPTPNIKTKKNGNVTFRYTTTSDFIKSIAGTPMSFNELNDMFKQQVSDYEKTGRITFYESSDGRRYLTHRITSISRGHGDVTCIKPVDTNGYIINNVGIADGSVVYSA